MLKFFFTPALMTHRQACDLNVGPGPAPRFVRQSYNLAESMQADQESQYIKIVILENGIEAQLIGSILDQREIPHRVRSYHDTAYDGLFQVQKGWGKLYAPQEYKKEILQVIEQVRSDYVFSDRDD
jgi:hypothetical protein